MPARWIQFTLYLTWLVLITWNLWTILIICLSKLLISIVGFFGLHLQFPDLKMRNSDEKPQIQSWMFWQSLEDIFKELPEIMLKLWNAHLRMGTRTLRTQAVLSQLHEHQFLLFPLPTCFVCSELQGSIMPQFFHLGRRKEASHSFNRYPPNSLLRCHWKGEMSLIFHSIFTGLPPSTLVQVSLANITLQAWWQGA
jgi:hypothetical protein